MSDLLTNEYDSFSLKCIGFKIVHHNVNHILNKMDQIRLSLSSNKIDIYGACETFLVNDVSNNELNIQGYNMVRADRMGPRGGGIVVYIRDCYKFIHRDDLNLLGIETIWIEVILSNRKNLMIGFVYRPPSSLISWYEQFDHQVNQVGTSINCDAIIMGDFNVDANQFDKYACLDSLMTSYGYKQVISMPTRVTDDTASIIDHVYVTNVKK